jgi:hypothetical protein
MVANPIWSHPHPQLPSAPCSDWSRRLSKCKGHLDPEDKENLTHTNDASRFLQLQDRDTLDIFTNRIRD